MTLCLIAALSSCTKCPAFKICLAKRLLLCGRHFIGAGLLGRNRAGWYLFAADVENADAVHTQLNVLPGTGPSIFSGRSHWSKSSALT